MTSRTSSSTQASRVRDQLFGGQRRRSAADARRRAAAAVAAPDAAVADPVPPEIIEPPNPGQNEPVREPILPTPGDSLPNSGWRSDGRKTVKAATCPDGCFTRYPRSAVLAAELANSLQRPIVFTNGVFDLLHAGHVACLEQARSLGSSLVVGINTDASARRLGKGPMRPCQAAADRARVVAALASVSAVLLFDEDKPLALMCALRPDIYVKGGDYVAAQMAETALMAQWGGRTVIVPRLSRAVDHAHDRASARSCTGDGVDSHAVLCRRRGLPLRPADRREPPRMSPAALVSCRLQLPHRRASWRRWRRWKVGCAGSATSSPASAGCPAARGFVYRDAAGRPVRDEATLQRIRALAVPPAWQQVWICSDAQGPPAGHRSRCARPQAVPLSRRMAGASRPDQVRAAAPLRPDTAAHSPPRAARAGRCRARRGGAHARARAGHAGAPARHHLDAHRQPGVRARQPFLRPEHAAHAPRRRAGRRTAAVLRRQGRRAPPSCA